MVMKRIASLSRIASIAESQPFTPAKDDTIDSKSGGRGGSFMKKKRSQAEEEANKESGATISSLEIQVAERDETIASLRNELRIVKSHRKQENTMAEIQNRLLTQSKNSAVSRLEKMVADLDDTVAITEYASLIKRTAPLLADSSSSYAVRLQAQLCKSLHHQTVLENQLVMTTAACERTVQEIKNEVEQVLGNKIASGAEYTKKLEDAESDKDELVREYEDKLSTRAGLIENLVDIHVSKLAAEAALVVVTTEEEKRQEDDPETARRRHRIVSEKVANVTRTLEERRQNQEQTVKSLRTSLEDKARLVRHLEGTVQSQQDDIGRLNGDLDQLRQRVLRREAKRSHLRHASLSTVTTSASRLRPSSSYSCALTTTRTMSSNDLLNLGRNESW